MIMIVISQINLDNNQPKLRLLLPLPTEAEPGVTTKLVPLQTCRSVTTPQYFSVSDYLADELSLVSIFM